MNESEEEKEAESSAINLNRHYLTNEGVGEEEVASRLRTSLSSSLRDSNRPLKNQSNASSPKN